MPILRLKRLTPVLVLLTAACAGQQHSPTPTQTAATPTQPAVQTAPPSEEAIRLPPLRTAETAAATLSNYAAAATLTAAAQRGDDAQVSAFLAANGTSAQAESLRNEWLKNLGERGQTELFRQQYRLLDADARSQEVKCYAQLFGTDQFAGLETELVRQTGGLPNGCNSLLQTRAAQGALDTAQAWRRVRGLISNDRLSNARALAAALGSPLESGSGQGAQENLLRDIISPSAQKNSAAAAERLRALSGSLTREQAGFAWGVLGLVQAKNQDMETALAYYRQAERGQLNDEQFEWYARAALRLQRWEELADIIGSMPEHLKKDPAWSYWLARSYAARGQNAAAQPLFVQAAQSGRNFYALLANEELGKRVDTRNNAADARRADIERIAADGAIQRALTLFQQSQSSGDWKMRRQAQAEWRYATRGMNETAMLAAAQLAFERGFYEMAINTAERTDKLFNYNLRYITPYRSTMDNYAAQAGIDPAWVYGLIRQESRFITGAQSSVGAQGLMQVMPATAREIARKIGMDAGELYSIDGNIRMGTWYMADGRRSLSGSEVLATAGYNAGNSRARKWQAPYALEGAVYAETIPFNETRDYVKKVMANATYYASLLGRPNVSLKQRIGIIPAR